MNVAAARNNLSMEAYRKQLAGLVDEAKAAEHPKAFETQAVDLAFVMAHLYNREELDAINLWSRIASGLEQSARENSGDASSLVNGCLLHIKADAGKTACSEALGNLLGVVSSQDEAWQRQWSRWIVNHIHIITVKARALWQAKKEAK